MGSNTIIAIVVGAILVIVGFALWPVLNGATNSLYSYFRNSCDDGNGNRFLSVYVGTHKTAGLEAHEYSTSAMQHGGPGMRIGVAAADTGAQELDTDRHPDSASYGFTTTLDTVNTGAIGTTCAFNASAAIGSGFNVDVVTYQFYNEQGDLIGSAPLGEPPGFGLNPGDTFAFDIGGNGDTYEWVEVAPMLQRFAGINNLLLTILPVVSIAGFLGISGAKLYSYGKGTASIGSSISTSVFTLIGIVIAMVIAGPIMGAAVDANQVVVSGQYQVNSTFGNIIQLLFAMIPVVYIAGLVTLVGLQARTALMGGQGGGSLG